MMILVHTQQNMVDAELADYAAQEQRS